MPSDREVREGYNYGFVATKGSRVQRSPESSLEQVDLPLCVKNGLLISLHQSAGDGGCPVTQSSESALLLDPVAIFLHVGTGDS